MKRYLLDTHIVLACLRGHALYRQIEEEHQLAGPDAVILISVATKAELMSIGFQNNWEENKMNLLSALFNKLIIVDINEADRTLLEAYAQIDAFRKGNASTENAPDMSNHERWMAATAHVTNAALITTSNSFDRLNGRFFQVIRYVV